jgi:hypothetical protein
MFETYLCFRLTHFCDFRQAGNVKIVGLLMKSYCAPCPKGLSAEVSNPFQLNRPRPYSGDARIRTTTESQRIAAILQRKRNRDMGGTTDDWLALLAAFTVAASFFAVVLGSTFLFIAAGVTLFVVILIELTRTT